MIFTGNRIGKSRMPESLSNRSTSLWNVGGKRGLRVKKIKGRGSILLANVLNVGSEQLLKVGKEVKEKFLMVIGS